MAAKKLGRLVLALLVSAITAVVVVGSGGSIAWANAVGTSGSGAGTNIGDASVLTGTTNGSLTGTQAEDWYVVYPATIGGIVQLQITDTAPSTVCQGLFYSIYNTDGTGGTLASSPLGPGSPFEGPVSSAGSDRYYVEITPYGCSPTASKPLTYSVTIVSGGGGPAPGPPPAAGRG